MKSTLFSIFRCVFTGALLLLSDSNAFSQSELSLDSCYAYARNNYPLIKQHQLIARAKEFSVSNATKLYLPQLSINGQATYQSDVTKIPIDLPNTSIPTLTKDQYKLYGELTQPLTDVVVIHQQKEIIRSNSEIEVEKLEVELYKLKERINQVYFGILLIDAQIKQTELLKKDIQNGMEKTSAALAYGTALKSNLNMLKAELLKAGQRTTELKSGRKAYLEMLGLLINKPVDEGTVFEMPPLKEITLTINRPELRLFDAQRNLFSVQDKLINAKNIPRLAFFFQGGYGRPALNMLNPDFDFYYVGGLRLSWNVSAFYTFKKDKQLLLINRDMLELQRQTFLFNTTLSLTQQQSELLKLQELIHSDDEIISLRNSIKKTANTQLENGTITVTDYVTYVNAEDLAVQAKLLHQMQLLMTQYNAQNLSGN